MTARKQSIAIRAGGFIGAALGFCFACGVVLLTHTLRRYDRFWATRHPLIYLFGIVPVVWLVLGVQMLKKLEAAD